MITVLTFATVACFLLVIFIGAGLLICISEHDAGFAAVLSLVTLGALLVAVETLDIVLGMNSDRIVCTEVKSTP